MAHETKSPYRGMMLTRRAALQKSLAGLGGIALASLLNENLFAAVDPLAPRPPHFAAKAKNIIYLNMTGAPSQLDLYDFKPKLVELNGKPVPESYLEGLRFPFIKGVPNLLGPQYEFKQRGKAGTWISEKLPHIAGIADEITVIRTMHTQEVNHVPAESFMMTGSPRLGRPCLGSWVTYGLGSACRDLPGFVVLASGKAGRCGTSCSGNGFLPSVHQPVQFRGEGEPVLYLDNPAGMDGELRRETLDAIHDLNEGALAAAGDPEIATRIASYEMAYQMQTSVPQLMDIAAEPAAIHELYGTEPGKVSFANNCLLARRLVERGVRFVQINHGGWDHHGGGDQNLVTGLPERCKQVDQGSAALVMDLKRRGMLEDTLVIWGGEFGRTPMIQGEYNPQNLGRDHLPSAFTVWVAGGGMRAGHNHGVTDDLGVHGVQDQVSVHDFHATILHCLGLDHTKLTYKFQGREFRLTDVEGELVTGILI